MKKKELILKIKINKYNLKYLYIFFLLLIFISYIGGFFLKEDSSGGGELDFSLHIFNNYILFHSSNLININWNLYDSTSLPLHYIISKLFVISTNENIYKFFWFIFSFSGFFFIYFTFLKKLKIKNLINLELIFLSSFIFLSPYYRTSAFWGLEENIGVVCLVITIYFYYCYKENNSFNFFFLTILFASTTFFTRQSYMFLPIIVFLLLFDQSNYLCKKNKLLTILFIIFFIPVFYFFFSWEGLVPPMVQNTRTSGINLNNIPTILNIYLIYLAPFVMKYILSTKIKLNLNYLFLTGVFFLIYLFIFQNYEWTSNGSGILPKLLKILFFDDFTSKILLLFISYLTLILILIMFSNSVVLMLYFFINLLLFCFIDVVFQEYFDPICLIMLLCFAPNSYLSKKYFNLINFIPPYSLIILLGSIIYHQ